MDRKAPQLGPLNPRPPVEDGLSVAAGRRAPTLEPDDAVAKKKRRPRWIRRLIVASIVLILSVSVVPVAVFSVVPVWTSSFMLQYQAARIGSRNSKPPLQHRWVPWENISNPAKLAVVAAEDQRFVDHVGIDFKAIGKALEHNRSSGTTRGASTITQQVAKNMFLWPRRSWLRKGLEAGYALLIELIWTKQRILEVYLNIAEFGPGVYGVEAASQAYFRKPASALNPREAALLAAVLPNPKRLSVAAPSLYVENRAAWIRGQMENLGIQKVKSL